MTRDGFKCCSCGDTKSTLNVHHTVYNFNFEPWEYQENHLRTLCQSCHELTHEHVGCIKQILMEMSVEDLDLFWCDIMCAVHTFGVKEIAFKCQSMLKESYAINSNPISNLDGGTNE